MVTVPLHDGLNLPTLQTFRPACSLCNIDQWDMTLCSLVEVHRCFRGPQCLHLQGQRLNQQESRILLGLPLNSEDEASMLLSEMYVIYQATVIPKKIEHFNRFYKNPRFSPSKHVFIHKKTNPPFANLQQCTKPPTCTVNSFRRFPHKLITVLCLTVLMTYILCICWFQWIVKAQKLVQYICIITYHIIMRYS
jgi:hypothetical protein